MHDLRRKERAIESILQSRDVTPGAILIYQFNLHLTSKNTERF